LFRGAILAGAVALSWQGQGIRVDEGGLLIAAACLACGVDKQLDPGALWLSIPSLVQ